MRMRMSAVVSASASLLALFPSVNGLPSYPVGDPALSSILCRPAAGILE